MQPPLYHLGNVLDFNLDKTLSAPKRRLKKDFGKITRLDDVRISKNNAIFYGFIASLEDLSGVGRAYEIDEGSRQFKISLFDNNNYSGEYLELFVNMKENSAYINSRIVPKSTPRCFLRVLDTLTDYDIELDLKRP